MQHNYSVEKHLNTLEFPKILERLAYYAMFSASKELALALQPSPYLAEVQAWQTETTEAYHLLSVKVNIGVGSARDVRPLVERARKGASLSPAELLEIRQTLMAGRNLQRTIVRLAESYPRLADIAGRIEPCPGVINEIGQAIDERGEVKSIASPTLARIRRELETAYGRLMDKLNRIITSTQYRHYLQETLITQRAGRYVVPLKAEFKGKIQGVIHDQSASGATLFIEPLTTVELNNRWRQLQLDEADEIRRILAELSALVGRQGRFIQHTVAALAELDLALAKAKYAAAIDAVEPVLFSLSGSNFCGVRHAHVPNNAARRRAGSSNLDLLSLDEQQGDKPGRTLTNTETRRSTDPADSSTPSRPAASPPVFDLIAARHPLLDPKTVVPIDVTLAPDTRILVITGPNTGGKTVSLKTVGLLAAMTQAGLRIPAAEGSTLPIFNHILADIGDEQSIEQSLSTFSSHMTNIVQILAQCDRHSLVILDELGAGTDPVEGSALARSILSYLLKQEVTTFVATHYSELKAYAHATPGIANASMEFDLDTLAPTYRLRIGLPGASNAFAIARRLGLREEIINQARGLVGEDARQIEAMLVEIKAQTEAAHRIRRLAEAEQEKVQDSAKELERRLAEIDAERRDILNSTRADARREIKAVREEIRALKTQAQALLQSSPETTKQADGNQLQKSGVPERPAETGPISVADIETRLEKLERKTLPEEAPQISTVSPEREQAKLKGPIRPGDKVFINQFDTIGEVMAVQNEQVDIQLGHFRTTVPLVEVELRAREASSQPESRQSVQVPAVESPGMELDLRGQVAADALLSLDQYLDQAFLAQLPWVRIIHGKGSGTLRQAVRQELSSHPLIKSYRPGERGEGGEGVTVAKLALG